MRVRQYLTEDSSQPLVIHGDSGVGKTSFMAKVASQVNWCTTIFLLFFLLLTVAIRLCSNLL
jgi:hypothetical protein